jgi:hypothetical protein
MWEATFAPASAAMPQEVAIAGAAERIAAAAMAQEERTAAPRTAVERAAAHIAAAVVVAEVALVEGRTADAAEHTAAVAAGVAEVAEPAEHIAAGAEHTAAAAVEAAGPAAAKPGRMAGLRSLLHIPAEVVAMERPVDPEALPPPEPLPPLPDRRKTGSLSSRAERRVRIADISS